MPEPNVTMEELIELIREQLKLGDAPLTAETRLIGGDHDLDSLDVLMMVSAIEKRFGRRIPSDAIGPEVFEDIASLHTFLASRPPDPAADA